MDNLQIIRELFNLALEINQQGTHHVFIALSPHVDWLSVRIFRNSWIEDANPTYSDKYDYNSLSAEMEADEIKKIMLSFKED